MPDLEGHADCVTIARIPFYNHKLRMMMCYWPVKTIIQISKHAPQQRGHPHPRHITVFPSFRTIENILRLSKRGNFTQTIYTRKTDTIQTQAACLPTLHLLARRVLLIHGHNDDDRLLANNGSDRMRLAFKITQFAGYTLPLCDHSFRAGNNERRFPPKLFQRIRRFAFISYLLRPSSLQLRSLFLCWHMHRIPKDAETWEDIEVDRKTRFQTYIHT